jgi:hypothetical protein
MHIIQYLMNMNLKCFAYDGQGRVNFGGVAYSSITIFEFRSILKFVPFDVGYDLKGIEWRIVNVYYENNISFYDASNGIGITRFDNFNLFNAAEINAIHQNKLDGEIEIIINKIKQLNLYIPTPETQPFYLPIKFRPDDIAYDIDGIQWRIKSVLEQNNSIVINASNKLENRIFNQNELYDSSEINNKYQNNLNSKIENLIDKINQLESVTLAKNKFSKGELCLDNKLHDWTVVDIFNFKNKTKYQATNGKTIKIFNENDLKKKSIK